MRGLLFVLALFWISSASATTYFADDGATGANDGTSIGDAFTTLKLGMETIGASDSLIVCPPHAESLSSNIEPVADGTASDPIVVVKDDGTHWPDSSGTPTITNGAYALTFNQDDFWEIHGLTFTGASVACISQTYTKSLLIKDCTFLGFFATVDVGITSNLGGITIVRDCIFDGNAIGSDGNNYGIGVKASSALVRMYDCTFDGLSMGINGQGGNVDAFECDFGQAEVNTNDVYLTSHGGHMRLLGGLLTDNTKLSGNGYTHESGSISRYYIDASKRPMIYRESDHFTLISDYGTVHSGGGDYSLKLSNTTANVGPANPLKILECAVHADSAESRDYTIAAYRNAAWGTAPTAAQFYLEVIYQDADTLKSAVSTAVLTNASTWYDLTVSSISPNHDGPVHVALWLETYDTDGALFADPRMTATDETYHETSYWGQPMLSYLYTAPAAGSRIMMIH